MRYESRFRFTAIALLALLLVLIGSQTIRAQGAWLNGIEITDPVNGQEIKAEQTIEAETDGTDVDDGPYFYYYITDTENSIVGNLTSEIIWEGGVSVGKRYFKTFDTSDIVYYPSVRLVVKVSDHLGNEFASPPINVTINNSENFEPPSINVQHPPNNSLIYGLPVNFNWSSSELPDNVDYVFQLNSFSPINTGDVSFYSYNSSLNNGESYEWRIGFEINNLIGNWSNYYSFDYTNTLNSISLSDDNIGYKPNVRLAWSQTNKPDNCRFRVQLKTGADTLVDNATTAYNYNVNLADNTQYQWRVCNWHDESRFS